MNITDEHGDSQANQYRSRSIQQTLRLNRLLKERLLDEIEDSFPLNRPHWREGLRSIPLVARGHWFLKVFSLVVKPLPYSSGSLLTLKPAVK